MGTWIQNEARKLFDGDNPTSDVMRRTMEEVMKRTVMECANRLRSAGINSDNMLNAHQAILDMVDATEEWVLLIDFDHLKEGDRVKIRRYEGTVTYGTVDRIIHDEGMFKNYKWIALKDVNTLGWDILDVSEVDTGCVWILK